LISFIFTNLLLIRNDFFCTIKSINLERNDIYLQNKS